LNQPGAYQRTYKAPETQPKGSELAGTLGGIFQGERRDVAHTDIKQAPWYVVNADNKKCARLNCIHHLLGMIPYKDLTPEPIALPPRQTESGYVRPPITDQTFIPEIYLPECKVGDDGH
jgi:polyphosphate kinase 2 PPK2